MKPLTHWRYQRRSALVLIPLLIWLLMSLSRLPDFSSNSVQAWLASPWQLLLLWLMISIGFFHGRLGMQVILQDYVADQAKRKAYNRWLAGAIFFAWGLFSWGALVHLMR